MSDTDQDKPEVVEKRMEDALRNALRMPPQPHQKKGASKSPAPKR